MAHSDFIVGIGAGGIRIYDGHAKKEWRAEYPQGLVENLEVKNSEGYKKWWTELINKLAIHGKNVLIILEEPTLFYKNISKEEEGEAFWKEVPLIPEHISKNILNLHNGLTAIAVNMKLHETVMNVLKEHKSEVTGIYPEIILPAKLPAEIMKLRELPAEGNFLKLYVSQTDMDIDQSHKFKIYKYSALGLVVLVLLVIGTVFFEEKKESPKAEVKKLLTIAPVVRVATTTPIPTPLTTASESAVNLKTVNILVLNDSGVNGKAKEVAKFLTDHGYVNVETGNAVDFKYNGLQIKVSSDKALAEKLFSDLSENFNPATPEMNWQQNPGKDAVVIIGN
jgi:hypothetical protein